MTCADARHIILTGDPSALRERPDAAFRDHLDRCASCAAAAGHVVDDLGRLRAALIARGSHAVVPPRRRRRVAMTLVPMALAAELALFAFLSNRDGVNPILDRPVIDDSVTTLLSQVPQPNADTSEVVAVPPARLPQPRATPVVATIDDSTTNPDTIATPAVPVAPQLQVQPASARQQVAVIATSNPKITVVWITKGDSL